MKKREKPEIKIIYRYTNPQTIEGRKKAEQGVNRAYDILFEEVVRRGLAKSSKKSKIENLTLI
jgi:hypothetical protein